MEGKVLVVSIIKSTYLKIKKNKAVQNHISSQPSISNAVTLINIGKNNHT